MCQKWIAEFYDVLYSDKSDAAYRFFRRISEIWLDFIGWILLSSLSNKVNVSGSEVKCWNLTVHGVWRNGWPTSVKQLSAVLLTNIHIFRTSVLKFMKLICNISSFFFINCNIGSSFYHSRSSCNLFLFSVAEADFTRRDGQTFLDDLIPSHK